MKYSKLVRDKIPKMIKQKGGTPITHVADEQEYWQKLKEKLQEEVDEFVKNESLGEIADVLEVLDAICEYKCCAKSELQAVKNKKAEERGRFENRVILDEA